METARSADGLRRRGRSRVSPSTQASASRSSPTTSIPESASRVTARSSGRRSAGSRRVSTFEDAARRASHGPDPEPYLELIRKYEEAGFTHVYVHQIGDNQEEFAEFARRELMDRL